MHHGSDSFVTWECHECSGREHYGHEIIDGVGDTGDGAVLQRLKSLWPILIGIRE